MKSLFSILILLICFSSMSQTQSGKASFYADKFEGRETASGEIYRHAEATAAHRKLPFNTKVKVTNLNNNRSTIVRINDRGPFIRGRIIDLSKSVAEELGALESGIIEVTIEVLGKDSDLNQVEIQKPEKELPVEKSNRKVTEIAQPENVNNQLQKKSSQAPVIKELYKLNIEKIEPDFYGVQIGSFRENSNLLRLASNLKISYDETAIIQIKELNDSKLYTLILGQFKNRTAAEKFLSKIDKKYPDAFVITLKDKE
ncbi:septal ring lytic transglycosylase RlpA family protein [Psychroflexus aestuariivivens]|uniref:septal ring lytic transglycosylase RlpA family protein n=1 Tax=Psychroflexus aestuariivivens TaxID=1795040 RepID=UPI000FD944A2|nr:septal ring lytic transglycosylase RlpA family protein [Psychroflexus aestuariivivens]